jgi:hypothetical protein
MGQATAVQTAVSQHLNNAWKPRAGSVAFANRTGNTCLRPDHIRTLGRGDIRIKRQAPAAFGDIRRDPSSLLSDLAAPRLLSIGLGRTSEAAAGYP